MYLENESKCSKLSSALACIEKATSKITTLQERIKRESIVLDEKCQACVKLLVQIGQDTAISHQHNKLVTKQRERIVHLKKVDDTTLYLCAVDYLQPKLKRNILTLDKVHISSCYITV